MKRTVILLTGLALAALAVLAGCVEQNNTGGSGSGENQNGQTAQGGSGDGGERENSDSERAALVNAAMAGAPEIARGYGNMPWGSTPEEVMAAYGFRADPVSADYDPNISFYYEENVILPLSPEKGMRSWRFMDKKLIAVHEVYNIEDVNKDRFKAELTAKYGPSDDTYNQGINPAIYWNTYKPFLWVVMTASALDKSKFNVTYYSDTAATAAEPPPPPPSHELDNTSWRYTSGISGGIGNIYTSTTGTLDFGNGKYLLNAETDSNNMFVGGSSSETGLYYISGDTVTLRSSEGRETQGTIIGNTLTINSTTYRRIQ